MRVACVGNMNNNFFTLTRYLREAGVDAHLLVPNSSYSHFMPHADSYDLSYREFTTMLNWGAQAGFRASIESCRADLSEFDVLIGCEYAPAFVDRTGRRLDIFIATGDDILVTPFYRPRISRLPLTNYLMARHQAQGIRSARSVAIGPNKINEEALHRLGYKGPVSNTIVPPVHIGTYSPAAIAQFGPQTHWFSTMSKIRSQHKIVVMHHSRQDWCGNTPPHYCKANDVLIRGFKRFVARSDASASALVLVEYGCDVLASKQLVRELGLEDNIFWLPPMLRKDIMPCLQLADIGCGEFRTSAVISGTVSEVLTMEKPLLSYRDDKRHLEFHPTLYPIMNAGTPEQVEEALADYAKRPAHYAEMGREGARWHRRHAVEPSVSFVLEQIGKRHDQRIP